MFTNNFHVYNDIPLISIENFDDPLFKDSKYILTSPRSLLACEQLGIKVKFLFSYNFSSKSYLN
jgi:hypothetical protein